MTDSHQKKEVKKSNMVNTVVAGIAGVVAGGVAVAAAVVMSDKKNQKKVKEAWDDTKEKVAGYIETIKAQPVVEKSVQKLGDVAHDIKQKIDGKE